MNIIDRIFAHRKKSAKTAKERLQIIISHQRADEQAADFLPQLRRELVQVISKYVELDEEQINIQMHREDKHSTIEMNIVVPDLEKVTA